MGGNEALRVAMAEAARERVGHKLEVEAEESSVIELEDYIQKTIKEELHTLSPEVSTSCPWIDMYKYHLLVDEACYTPFGTTLTRVIVTGLGTYSSRQFYFIFYFFYFKIIFLNSKRGLSNVDICCVHMCWRMPVFLKLTN